MAEHVFQDLGDRLTKALISADFDRYRSIFTLPVTFTPRGGKAYTLTDDDSLRADFDLYVSIIKLHGVTDIYRQFLAIEAERDGEMTGHWLTHILVRANLLVDPFNTTMRLRQVQGQWRIGEIESSEGHLNWTLGRAVVSSGRQFGNPGA